MVTNKRNIVFILLMFVFFLFSFSSYIYSSDDDYQSIKYLPDQKSKSIIKNGEFQKVLDAPSLLIKSVKTIFREPFVFIERYHLQDKLFHIYKKITDRGFYPVITDIGSRHGIPEAVEFDYGLYSTANRAADTPFGIQYRKVFYIEEYSDVSSSLEVNSWAKIDFNRYKDYGLQFKGENLFGTQNYIRATYRYKDNPREDYFYEGPNFSLGEGSSFSLEEHSVSLAFGRYLMNKFHCELGVIASTTSIDDAKDNDKRAISQISGLNGANGADILGIGLSVENDTRDSFLDPKCGGFRRFKLGYYSGINGDKYDYVKAQFDLASYFPIGEYFDIFYWDSAFAIRASGEFNSGVGGESLPFYDLARLGGSESVRGYQYNRFFDDNNLFYSLEYRYNIWGAREYKVDATVFFDCGWIFDEVSEFELDKHKESYGIGFRFLSPQITVTLVGAHSNEGTEVYFKVNPIF